MSNDICGYVLPVLDSADECSLQSYIDNSRLGIARINVDELYNFPNEFIPETGGTYTNAGRPARWVAWEERDGVRVRVVYEPAGGKIVTAFPDSNPTPPTLKPIKKSCG